MRGSDFRLVVPGLVLAVLAGCDGSSHEAAGPAAALTFEGGLVQSGAAGESLPVTVHVVDAEGRPVSGQSVNFYVPADGVHALIATDISRADGTARMLWEMGPEAGVEKILEARTVNSAGTPVTSGTLRVTVTLGAPASMSMLTEYATAAHGFSLPITVQVKDGPGNPIPGVPVTFAAAPGSGSPTPEIVETDQNGYARTSWTLAPTNGAQSLSAKVANLDPLSFTVTARDLVLAERAKGTWDMTLTPSAGNRAGACQAMTSSPASFDLECPGFTSSCLLSLRWGSTGSGFDGYLGNVAADGTFDIQEPSRRFYGMVGQIVEGADGSFAASGSLWNGYGSSITGYGVCEYTWTAERRSAVAFTSTEP